MGNWKLVALAAALCGAFACGNGGSEGDAGGDVGASQDVGSASDASAQTDGAVPTGACGDPVHECVCGTCVPMTDLNARSACISNCLATQDDEAHDCAYCLAQASAACCPAEFAAEQSCYAAAEMPSDAGPPCTSDDAACYHARCPTQEAAYSACLTDARANNATCQALTATCFGAYPISCH